jgi:amino acid permease
MAAQEYEALGAGETWRGQRPGTSLSALFVNLVKSVVGAMPRDSATSLAAGLMQLLLLRAGTGVLVLPFNLSQSGWALGTALLAALAAATTYSLHALSEVQRVTRVATYSGCVRALLGVAASRALDAVQVLYMTGVLITMLRIILDQLSSITSPQVAVALLSGISAFLLFPLTLLRHFESLRWSSAAGVVSLLMLTCLAAARAPWRGNVCAGAGTAHPSFRTARLAGVPQALGSAALAFECQVNYMPLVAELRNATRARVWALIAGAIGSALAYYTVTALLAYATFCDAIAQDMLDSYGEDLLAVATRVAMVVQTAVSFPLTSIVLRDLLDAWLPAPAERQARDSGVRIKLLSCGIVLLCTVVAVLRPPLQTVMALTGAAGGCTLAFVFPGALLFQARRRVRALGHGDDLSAALLLGADTSGAAEEEAFADVVSPLLFAVAGAALAVWCTAAVLGSEFV